MKKNSFRLFLFFTSLFFFTPFIITDHLFQALQSGKFFYFELLTELLFPFFLFILFRYPSSQKIFQTPLTKILFGFTFVTILSGILGKSGWSSFGDDTYRQTGWFFQIHLFLFYLYVYFIFSFFPHTKKRFLQIGTAIAAILSFFAILESLKIISSISPDILPRASSFFNNPIYFASFLILPFFFSLMLAIDTKRFRLLFLFCSVLIFLGILASGTRGALLGIIFGLVTFAFFHFKKIFSLKSLSILSGVVLFFGMFFLIFPTFKTSFSHQKILSRMSAYSDASAMNRLTYWKIGIQGWMDSPIFGLGPENYSSAYASHFDKTIKESPDVWADKPHNQLVELLTTTGLVGFLLYTSALCVAIIYLFQTRKNSSSQLAIAALVAYLVQDFFIYDTLIAFMALIAFLAWIVTEPITLVENHSDRSTKKTIFLVGLASLSVVCVILFIQIPSIQEFVDLSSVRNTTVPVEQRIRILKQSLHRSYVYDYAILGDTAFEWRFRLAMTKDPKNKQSVDTVDQIGIEAYEKALIRDPNNVKTLYHLGLLSVQHAEFDQTLTDDHTRSIINRAIELAPERPEPKQLLNQMTPK